MFRDLLNVTKSRCTHWSCCQSPSCSSSSSTSSTAESTSTWHCVLSVWCGRRVKRENEFVEEVCEEEESQNEKSHFCSEKPEQRQRLSTNLIPSLTETIVESRSNQSPVQSSTTNSLNLIQSLTNNANDGSRIQLRLSLQGRLDWRFWNREIQSSIQIHKKRILFGIQIHNRRRIRHEKHRSRFENGKGSDLGHWWVEIATR